MMNTGHEKETATFSGKQMTSRERVIKAVNHEPVDRVPIDLGMTTSTGISAFAYWNLRKHMGLSIDNIEIVDMVQMLARVDEEILERFKCDCIMLHLPWKNPYRWNVREEYSFIIPSHVKPSKNEDGSWIVNYNNGHMKMPEAGFFFDGDWLDISNVDEDDYIDALAKEAEKICKETNYYTSLPGFAAYFRTNTDWLMKMLLDPEEVIWENRAKLNNQLAKAHKIIKKMGKYIQSVRISSDLGTQKGPWCNPKAFEEISAPFYKEFCKFIHENSGLKVHVHTCGSIKPFIPILIDCGIDIIDPVQISADNMDPQELKNEFGDKITFWGGGCDTQNVLGTGTPAEVAENVKKNMSIFKQRSGYVFSQVHNIMGDVPPENIISMLDTAYKESGA